MENNQYENKKLNTEKISEIMKKDAELSEENLKKLKETKNIELFQTLEKKRQDKYFESMNKLINKN